MSNRGQIVARPSCRAVTGSEGELPALGVAIFLRLWSARAWDDCPSPQDRNTAPTDSLFDRILVDAPCSGSGVLRRHPDAKGKKDTGRFARHQVLQGEILERAFSVLRPGGVLVYSTCSTEPEETEAVIARFCQDHSDGVRESIVPWLPASAHPFVTVQGALSTMGNALGMDGFYAVRLRKTQGSL